MANPLRVDAAMSTVLSAFLDDPETAHYGLDLMHVTGHPSGTLYPILRWLRNAGWIEAHWEDTGPAGTRLPARRRYRLTPDGRASARCEVRARPTRAADPPARANTRALNPRPVRP